MMPPFVPANARSAAQNAWMRTNPFVAGDAATAICSAGLVKAIACLWRRILTGRSVMAWVAKANDL